jgi:serine/threonine protein kinase
LYSIGIGHFGEVFKGILMPEMKEARISEEIAVKSIKIEKNLRMTDCEFLAEQDKMQKNLAEEAHRMTSLVAFHVVQLKGFCLREFPYLLLIDFMKYGDLHTFLIKNKKVPKESLALKLNCGYSARPEKETKVPTRQIRPLNQMALEIADGMLFLENRKLVHRDLAARNCMVSSDFTIKIGDFGLSRIIDNSNYYTAQSPCDRPVRWMSPESLIINKFDSKSDVFSYGIVLWELVTYGATPYPVRHFP